MQIVRFIYIFLLTRNYSLLSDSNFSFLENPQVKNIATTAEEIASYDKGLEIESENTKAIRLRERSLMLKQRQYNRSVISMRN